MALNFGDDPVTALYVGDTPVKSLYMGSEVLWTPGGGGGFIGDNFDIDDVDDITALDGSPWVAETGSSTVHTAGVRDGMLRAIIPSNAGSWGTTRRHLLRYNDATLGADGYELRLRVGSKGSAARTTAVLARVSNTGFTQGVGAYLTGGVLAICHHTTGGSTTITSGYKGTIPGGFGFPPDAYEEYEPGDEIVVTGAGDLHELYRNGSKVAQWADELGTAESGEDYRSLGVILTSRRNMFSGARQISAAIDWVKLKAAA